MSLNDYTIFDESFIESELFNVTYSFDDWVKMIKENPELDLELNLEIGKKFNKFLLGPIAKIGTKILMVKPHLLDTFTNYDDAYLFCAAITRTIDNKLYIKIRMALNE